jgi:hypothetical protein
MDNTFCPLTRKKFITPVVINSGYTFEHEKIKDLLRCPITHKLIDSDYESGKFSHPDYLKFKEKPIQNILLCKCMMQMTPEYTDFNDKLLKCPLTQKIFKDPVILFSGITFERQAIEEYLLKDKDKNSDYSCAIYIKCPITHEQRIIYLTQYTNYLYQNIAIKNIVDDYLTKFPLKKSQQYTLTCKIPAVLSAAKTIDELNYHGDLFDKWIKSMKK